MSEGPMEVFKPEMKSYIWLQTADGSVQQVEEEVAMYCPTISKEVHQTGMGSSKNFAISLPKQVNAAILGLVLDYCRFHQVPGRSNKERKTFDEKFIRIDTKKLCELTSAADSLQLRPLVDLTSRALARMIEGKTPEEIRETFNLPDDLTEEEKLEPLRNMTDDPRIRLLNRLYARKRKELKEREKLKVFQNMPFAFLSCAPMLLDAFYLCNQIFICSLNGKGKVFQNVEAEEEQHVDERSVDDLLSFINGGDGDSKGVRSTKSKKKNRKRKEQARNSSTNDETRNHDQESTTPTSSCLNGDTSDVPSPSKHSELQDSASVNLSPNFDDCDIDDELDPAMKEEIDREVEDFARRLNSGWPDRMQEILSLGQDNRMPLPLSVNGNGFLRRYTGLDGR